MSTPAGTKVVVGPDNTLHAVYEDGGRIKYMASANGIIWTAPVIIGDTEAYTPTIAVKRYSNAFHSNLTPHLLRLRAPRCL